MRILTLIACLLFSAHCFAEESRPSLKLSVQMEVSEIAVSSKDSKAPSTTNFEIEVTAIVENMSDVDITVPTQTYDGDNPTCKGSNILGINSLCYSVETRIVGTTLTFPSPYRFSPVILKPRESTELPGFSEIITEPEKLQDIDYFFIVQKSYAERYGWWSGVLHSTAIVPEKFRHGSTNDAKKALQR